MYPDVRCKGVANPFFGSYWYPIIQVGFNLNTEFLEAATFFWDVFKIKILICQKKWEIKAKSWIFSRIIQDFVCGRISLGICIGKLKKWDGKLLTGFYTSTHT